MNIEIIGTLASIVILISFLTNNVFKIRCINIIGSIIFIIYGVLISSFSILLLNGILILIHIYYLLKEGKNRDK